LIKYYNKSKIKEFHHNLKPGATISAHLSICRLGLAEEIVIHTNNFKLNISDYIEESWKQNIVFRKMEYKTAKEVDNSLIEVADIIIATPYDYDETLLFYFYYLSCLFLQ